jgi:serine/threonine-protein kinase HipA
LTPAYDICPQARAGGEATQAMDIGGTRGRISTLDNVRSVCDHFLLSREDATSLVNQQHQMIHENWKSICDEAALAAGERARMWERAILNPFCFEGW